ncbi:beta-ketoacyl synthase N-terminal-like domain-containing protein [Streptomyces dubilierae]|uniref:Beta-ketoacyl synthase N-terminal-like domain-containing protein n=1 Tax=Streptomyces dubilierae TaxID=3075533 RepID=A0ABU2PL58_9ACTN|nr:beta-ketoacyl synthase N-terminal-like domain-containing protein [Streptomyces sp. DSM 41921]MDT0392075.1 beta-ketoacyl synthase N-terminal-like domain-containing protein [Streptomyces sp. DSM 41921]
MTDQEKDPGRDTLISGMGFSLPGPEGLCATSAEFWDIISTGACHVEQDGIYFGQARTDATDVKERFPELPRKALALYSPVQLHGLVSFAEACTDAGLDWRAGDLVQAGVLTARDGGDCWSSQYSDILNADRATATKDEINALGTRLALTGIPMDVTNVQVSVIGGTGPSFTISNGCTSSAVALGMAHRLITGGEVDVAVVTGADVFGRDFLLHYADLLDRYAELSADEDGTVDAMEDAALAMRSQMRPYDKNSPGSNMGSGSITLVLESRAHAETRGARPYARLMSQRTRRSPQHSAFAIDRAGTGMVQASRDAMAGLVEPDQIDYVNGGAEGDRVFHETESNIVHSLFGDRAARLPVTVQEACFGHNGGPLGNLGVAATSLMIQRDTVCPTAGCVDPADECAFDPVPGTTARPQRVDHALSFNYTVGMISSAILLGKA